MYRSTETGPAVDVQTGLAEGDTSSTAEPVSDTNIAETGAEGKENVGSKESTGAPESGTIDTDAETNGIQGGLTNGTPGQGDTGISGSAEELATKGQEQGGRDGGEAPRTAPPFIDPKNKDLLSAHAKAIAQYEKEGGREVDRAAWTQDEKDAESFLLKLGITGLTIIDSQGNALSRNGSNYPKTPGIGVFVVRPIRYTKNSVSFNKTGTYNSRGCVINTGDAAPTVSENELSVFGGSAFREHFRKEQRKMFPNFS